MRIFLGLGFKLMLSWYQHLVMMGSIKAEKPLKKSITLSSLFTPKLVGIGIL